MWAYDGKIPYSWVYKIIQIYSNQLPLALASPSASSKNIREFWEYKEENYCVLKYSVLKKSVHSSNSSTELLIKQVQG